MVINDNIFRLESHGVFPLSPLSLSLFLRKFYVVLVIYSAQQHRSPPDKYKNFWFSLFLSTYDRYLSVDYKEPG